jgi:hypothetical protein
LNFVIAFNDKQSRWFPIGFSGSCTMDSGRAT